MRSKQFPESRSTRTFSCFKFFFFLSFFLYFGPRVYAQPITCAPLQSWQQTPKSNKLPKYEHPERKTRNL